jgi:ferredoxin
LWRLLSRTDIEDIYHAVRRRSFPAETPIRATTLIRAEFLQAAELNWYIEHVRSFRPAAEQARARMILGIYGVERLCTCETCRVYVEGVLGTLTWITGQTETVEPSA